MIPYFLGNISAKNYRNRIVHAKIIASHRWDVFYETWCSVAAQEMAKHRAKFGWPSVSDVTAVTKPRCESH